MIDGGAPKDLASSAASSKFGVSWRSATYRRTGVVIAVLRTFRTEKVSLTATLQPLTLRFINSLPRYISRKASCSDSTISLSSTALGPAVETQSLSLHLPEIPAGSVASSYLSSGGETVAAASGWVSRQIGMLGSRAQHLLQRP